MYLATEQTPDRSLSRRNRRILSILKAEGTTPIYELAKRLELRISTIEVELKFLERLGLVEQSPSGQKL